jgi:hypothetical protein
VSIIARLILHRKYQFWAHPRAVGDRVPARQGDGWIRTTVVSAAQEAARKTIEESAFIKVSAEDQERFAEALIAPAPLTPAMERAIAHHRRLVRRAT